MDAEPLDVEVVEELPWGRLRLLDRVLVSNGARLYLVEMLLPGPGTSLRVGLCPLGADGSPAEGAGTYDTPFEQVERWDAVLAARVRATMRELGWPMRDPAADEV